MNTVKILLVGDQAVGKTSFLQRYVEAGFTETYIATIGVDFRTKVISQNDTPTKLTIWDCAGQARFKAITESYYDGSDGIILMYDVTNPESFHNISLWRDSILNLATNDVKLILLGNKCEAGGKRKVTVESGKSLASSFGIPFLEVSAKESLNIDETFQTIIQLLATEETSKVLPSSSMNTDEVIVSIFVHA